MTLPEHHAVGRSNPHAVAFLHAPSLNKLGHVGQGDVHAVLSQRVDIHLGELQHSLGTDVAGPNTDPNGQAYPKLPNKTIKKAATV